MIPGAEEASKENVASEPGAVFFLLLAVTVLMIRIGFDGKRRVGGGAGRDEGTCHGKDLVGGEGSLLQDVSRLTATPLQPENLLTAAAIQLA